MPNEFRILFTLIAVYVPVLISPGPNFLVVTQVAVSQSRRHAIVTALGISSGSTLLAILAATGMGLLLVQFDWLAETIRVFGGIYLAYIGWNIWRRAGQPITVGQGENSHRTLHQSYWYGLATNLSNPNSLVFFTTMFASILTSSLPTWVRAAGVACIGIISVSWNLSLANWFSGSRMQLAYCRAKFVINRVTACVLIGVAVKLLWER